MSKSCILLMVLIACLCAGLHGGASAAPATLTIPNVDKDVPDCLLILPEALPDCTVERCEVTYRRGAERRAVTFNFGCAPMSARNGFENPPDYVKVEDVRAKNAHALMSTIEDIDAPQSRRSMDIAFCILGKSSHLCGFTRIPKAPHSAYLAQIGVIKKFIRGLALQDAPAAARPPK